MDGSAPAPAESPSAAESPPQRRARRARRIRLVPGKLVPGTPYRLIRWLGEGGMGVVYLAEHTDIERKVAIKSLHPHLSRKPHVAQVFREEARQSARIGSPHIIDVFDFAELEDGRLLFVMEHLDGGSLVSLIEEAPLEPGRLLGILRQLAKGLGAAHEAGIVHRDVKPENVMLITQDGREDFVKILDFGIAAFIADLESTSSRAGTPHYISPEQVRKDSYDHRVDLYAVGCLAYELLTGKPPFDADTVREILKAHLEEEPVPPSQIVGPEAVPAAFEEVILRCLAKDPADRYVDMADFEAALCEAQIAADLNTPWDDLRIPEGIDPDRREWIVGNMPETRMIDSRPRWMWPAIAALLVALTGALAWALLSQDDESASAEAFPRVEELTRDARAAAGRAYYVYPPVEDPKQATAYAHVKSLESLDGEEAGPGRVRAVELRKEFAAALNRIADRLWAAEGGFPFAQDYYAMALMFEPANGHALERSVMSPGMLANLAQKAATNSFTAAELENARVLRAMGEEDEKKRSKALVAIHEEGLPARAASTEMYLGEFLESEGIVPAAPDDTLPSAEDGSPEEENATYAGTARKCLEALDECLATTDDAAACRGEANGCMANLVSARARRQCGEEGCDDEPVEVAAVSPEAGSDNGSGNSSQGSSKSGSSKSGSSGKRKRNKEKAKELVSQAKKAGSSKKSEGLYHQALAADPYNVAALSGLGDLFFDKSQYAEAVKFRERAVSVAKRSAKLRIALGDAYYKVFKYHDALEQYEKARSLGSRSASSRIAKVKGKIGG